MNSMWDGAWSQAGDPWTLMVVAAVLAVGALTGELVARTTRLSRVVGYVAVGAVPAALGLGVPIPWTGAARMLVDVALGLLLFEIGSRVRLSWLVRNPGLLVASLAESGLAAAAVGATLYGLGFDPAVVAVCAVVAVPGSAAVCGRVALELGAAGQVTRRMTLLTALNTLYAALGATALHLSWASGHAPDAMLAMAGVTRSFFGALLIGAMLAGAVALVARGLDLRDESTMLLLLGLIVTATSGALHFGLPPLLAPLLGGLLLRQATQRAWVWPRQFGTAGGALLLLLFILVGASWSPQALAAGGLGALALVVSRAAAKLLAMLLTAAPARSSWRQGLALSVASMPMSATALVLLAALVPGMPDPAREAIPIVVTSVAVLELLGPIAVHWALHMAGELGARPRAGRSTGGRP